MQCYTLQKNTSVKCTRKINTHKTTFGTPTPCYSGFGPNFDLGLLSTISISFVEITSIVLWVGLHEIMSHFSTIWPIQHGVNLIQKEVSSLEEAGFMFDSKCMKNPWSLFKGEPST
jgi:hypothetical protein